MNFPIWGLSPLMDGLRYDCQGTGTAEITPQKSYQPSDGG